MLKIKDNVDLKELEKFGFEYDEDSDCYVKQIFSQKTKGMFVPFVATGYLIFNNDGTSTDYITNRYWDVRKEHKESLNKIYDDLIQAGLVEKVGDDNE